VVISQKREETRMVICPIARAVHCTGCIFFKFCPAKTTLGDYGKENVDETSKKANKKDPQGPESEDTAGGSRPQ
jgi:hypothetical protein